MSTTVDELARVLVMPMTGPKRKSREVLLGQTLGGMLSAPVRDEDISVALAKAQQATARYDETEIEGAIVRSLLAMVSNVLLGFEAGQKAKADIAASRPLRLRLLLLLQDQPLTPTQISEGLNSPPTVVARVLRALREAGAVELLEVADLADRRTRLHQITPLGRRQLAAAGLLAGTLSADRPQLDAASLAPIVMDGSHRMVASVVALAQNLRRRDGSSPIVIDTLLETLDQVGSDRDRAAVLGEIVVQLRTSKRAADREQVQPYLDELGTLAAHGDPLVATRFHYETARYLMLQRDPAVQPRVQEALGEAERYAQQVPEPAGVKWFAWCTYTRAVLARQNGELADAVKLGEDAAGHFAQVSDHVGQCAALLLAGRCQASLDQRGEARESLEQAVAAATRGGVDRQRADAQYWLGQIDLGGSPSAAEPQLDEAKQTYQDVDDIPSSVVALSGAVAAEFLRRKQVPESYSERFERLCHLAMLLPDHDGASGLVWRRLGTIDRERGNTEHAASLLQRAVSAYAAQRDLLGQIASLSSLAVAREAGHDQAGAYTTACEAISLLSTHWEAWAPLVADRPDAAMHVNWCLQECAELVRRGKDHQKVLRQVEQLQAGIAGVRRLRTRHRTLGLELEGTPLPPVRLPETDVPAALS
jgi:tetratricopeptide (TPR) repeat protein